MHKGYNIFEMIKILNFKLFEKKIFNYIKLDNNKKKS